MARVEIQAQAWGVLFNTVTGGPLVGQSATLTNLGAGTNATIWTAVTGGTSNTSTLVSDSLGGLGQSGATRYVEEGTYTLSTGAVTRRVEATAGVTTVAVRDERINVDYPEYAGSVAAAVAQAATATRGRVYIPGGVRDISSEIAIASKNDIEIFGDGANSTRLRVTGNINLLNITGTCSRITIRDLWLGSDAARTSGTGIRVVGNSSPPCDNFRIENVVVQNMPSPVYLESLQQSVVKNLRIVQSISGASVGACLWLMKCISIRARDLMIPAASAGSWAAQGLILDSDCDSVMFEAAEILGAGSYGVLLRNSLGGASTGPRLVRLVDVYSESSASSGFRVEAGRDVRLRGCHAAVNAGHGFDLNAGTSIRANDCVAIQNGNHGFFVQSGAVDTRLMGCDATNNSQQTTNTYDGLRIEDNSTHVRAVGGRFGDYVFTLTNKQRYGISVGSTSTDYIVVSNNDLNGNQTGGLGNFSAGTHNAVGTGGNVT